MRVHIAATGVRRQQLRLRSRRSVCPFDLGRLQTTIADMVSRAIVRAKDKTDGESRALQRVGKLLLARELAQDPEFAPMVKHASLDALIHTMMQAFAAIQNRAMSSMRSSDAFQGHLAMLRSETFLLRLQLEGDKAKSVLAHELQKVAAIDPTSAARLSDHFAGVRLGQRFLDAP